MNEKKKIENQKITLWFFFQFIGQTFYVEIETK